MNQQEKFKIIQDLKAFCDLKGSQNKASKIIGVSSATISQMLNHNWDLITDEMWRKVSANVGTTSKTWQYVETGDAKLLRDVFTDAQTNSLVFAMVGNAGSGKTAAITHYANENKNVINISCSEYFDKRHFLEEIMQKLGKEYAGLRIAEMIRIVIADLKKMEKPLIILDEADKLRDQVLYFFITLYNVLEGHCGMIMIATHYLKRKIERGALSKRRGYEEIFSRFGRRFVELDGMSYTDCVQICKANGVEKDRDIKNIFQDSNGDVRRVKRLIHAQKTKVA